jgi:hypothetical protein
VLSQNSNPIEKFRELCRFDRVRVGYLEKLPFNAALSVYLAVVHLFGLDPDKLALGIGVVAYFVTKIITQELMETDRKELKQIEPLKVKNKRGHFD